MKRKTPVKSQEYIEKPEANLPRQPPKFMKNNNINNRELHNHLSSNAIADLTDQILKHPLNEHRVRISHE